MPSTVCTGFLPSTYREHFRNKAHWVHFVLIVNATWWQRWDTSRHFLPESSIASIPTVSFKMPPIPGVKPPAYLQVGPETKTDWIHWKEDWRDYALVQEVGAKPNATQVASFRIALGPEAKQLLRNQPVPKSRDADGNLVEDDVDKIQTLLKMMDSTVNEEINDMYERFVFTHRMQKDR